MASFREQFDELIRVAGEESFGICFSTGALQICATHRIKR